MPKRSQNRVAVKKKSSLNTKWLNNAMKSIGSASAATFKSIAPNISSSIKDTSSMVSSASKTIKGTTGNKVGKMLAQNKYINLAKDTVNQSIKDVKSGNLYNPNRAAEKYEKSVFGDDFDDFDDFDMDGGGEASVTFNYFDEGDDNNADASVMISDAITRGSEAQLKASKAQIDALIGVSSATIAQVQQGFTETNVKLDNINNTLDAILRYHEENTTNYYEHALAAFERIGGAVTDEFSGMKSLDNPGDLFKNGGGLNSSAYKDYVKKRLKRAVDESPAGMILPWLKDDDMLEMMLADPVGGITKGVIGGMIPKVVEGTLKEVDKTFGELIPNLLVRMGNWSDEAGNGKLKRAIGKIFGVNYKTKNNLDSQEINKDAATFDNMTRNAIVEVLPKYARESTAYLRQIAMHVTKAKNPDDLLSDAQIFDPTTNSYKSQKDMMKDLTDGFTEAIKSAFTSSDFGKALSDISGNLSGSRKKSYDEALTQFFTEITQSEKGMDVREYDLKNKDANIHKVLERVNKGKGKDILTEAIRYMYDNNLAIGSAAQAQLNAKHAWNERMNDMSQNYDRYNTLALGLDSNTDFKKLIENAQGNKAAVALDEAEKKRKQKDAIQSEKDRIKNDPRYRLRNPTKIAKTNLDDWASSEQYYKERNLSSGFIADKFTSDSFTDGIERMGGHAKNGLYSIMKGDSKGAMSEFSKIFTDQIKTMWNGVQENFFKPLGNKLFGKDEDGNNQGLFAGTRNKLNDTYKAFVQRINGKAYTDSKGEKHELEDPEDSLVSKAFNVFKDVKEGITFRLFGDKEDKEGKKDKVKGIFTTFGESIQEGLKGWKTAIFGESKDGEEAGEKDKKSIKDAFMKNLPDAILGAGGGALLGALSGNSLLGLAVGGPIGAAAMGFAGTFLLKSDKVKDYLFGEEITDPDGSKKRIGGLISQQTQEFVKGNKKSIIGGAALGAMKSIVFPSSAGLLSTLVGGPIAGAAMGVGWSLLKRSDMFQKFLYGDEESGKRGVVQAFKDIFKGKGSKDGDENKSAAMKALGMGAIGAGGFALSSALIGKMGVLGAMVTPGGPLGAAVIGAAVGIAASGNKFSKFLFGEKDEETGKRKGGLAQKFGNYLHVEILAPMKSKIQGMLDDAKTTIKYDILENIRLPFVAVADKMKEKLDGAKEFLSEKIDNFATAAYEKLVKPIGNIVNKIAIQPIKKIVSKATDIIYNTTKIIATAPFKLLGGIAKYAKSKIAGVFRGVRKFIFKGIAKTFGFVGGVIKTAFKPVGKLFKGAVGLAKNFFEKRRDKKDSKGKTGLRGKLAALGAKLTSDEWRKDALTSASEKAKAKAEDKKNKKLREIQDANRAIMGRILGYDEKYLTEENVARAEAAAKEQGIKLKWRGNIKDSLEQDPAQKKADLLKQSTAELAKNGETSDNMEVRMLTEQHKTNTILERIAEIAEQNGISMERAQQLYDETADQRKADAEKAGYDYDPDTDTLTPKDDNGDKKKSDGEKPSGKKGLISALKDSVNRHADDIEEAGGLKSFFKGKIASAKDFLDIRKGYQESELKGMVDNGIGKAKAVKDSAKGLFNRGREKVASIFSKFGKARAEGGPADKNDPLLVGDGGKDMSAAEIFVPKSNGTILSQKDGGIKVSVVSVDKGAKDELKDAIAHPLSKKEEKDEKKEKAKLLGYNVNELSEDGLNPGSFKNLTKAKNEMDAKEQQEKHDNAVLETLQEIRDKNTEHQNLWAKIFSKKGIVTMAILGFAILAIKNLPAVVDAVKGIASFLEFWNKEDGGTDGKDSKELAEDVVQDMSQVGTDLKGGHVFKAMSDFVLDEGKYDANSGGRVSLLANLGRKGVKKANKIGNFVKGGVNTIKSGFSGLKNIGAKLAGKGADDAVTYAGENSLETLSRIMAENAAEDTTKSSGIRGLISKLSGKATKEVAGDAAGDVLQDIGESSLDVWARELAEASGENVVKESVETLAESSTKTGASKVLSLVDDALKAICEKIAKKCPNIASSKIVGSIKGVMGKVSKVVTEKFPRISEKIAAATGIKGGAAAVTAGISTAVFVTCGAINGVSGTAKLFQVDSSHVDGWMRIISGAFGAIVAGTVVGSIIDIISGLVAEVLGFDFLNFLACAIYGVIAGKDNVADLNAAKEEFQQKYADYSDEQISTQYETQKAAGIIGNDVTLEQFQQGVSDGTYKISKQSFQDYNADQHQSIGYKIGKGFTNAGKSIKNFFGGKTSYVDANGQTYADNGDNTYTVYSADGTNLGIISAEAVDVSGMQESTKGGIKGTFQNVKDKLSTAKDKVVGGFNTAKENIVNTFQTAKENVANGIATGVNKAKDTIQGFIEGAANMVKSVQTGFDTIKANFDNPDMSVIDYMTADVGTAGDDTPLSGLINGVLNTAKVVMFPIMLIKGVTKRAGKDILKSVKDTAGKVATVAKNMGTEIVSLNKIARAGDLDALNNYTPNIDEDNPAGGFTKAVLTASKFVHYPSTFVQYMGKKIKEFMIEKAQQVGRVVVNTGTEVVNLNKIAAAGDLDALNNYTPNIDEDNPAGGFTKAILTASKFVHYPSTFVHYMGNKVKDFMIEKAQQVKTVVANTGTEIQRLHQVSANGDLDGLNGYTPNIDEDNPAGGFTKAILTASKFVHYPSTFVHYMGNKVKDFFDDKAEKVSAMVSASAEGMTELQNISSEGDLDALNNFSPDVDESTPLSGMVSAGLKGAKFIMYPSTLVHHIGNKIGDFIGDVKEESGDVKEEAKDFVDRLLEYTDTSKSMDSYNDEMMGDGNSLSSKILSPMIRAVVKLYVNVKRVWNSVADKFEDFFDFLDDAKDYANGDDDDEGGSGIGIKRSSIGGRGGENPEYDNGFSYYSQEDPRWKDKAYIAGKDDGATMGDSGCGPTAMAMVASQAAQGKAISPTDMAQLASASGYRDGTGTNQKFISYAGDTLGLSHTDVTDPSADFIRSSVENGNPVILNGVSDSSSAFTPAGHYVVAVGTDNNGNVLVNDPRGKSYNTAYTPEQLASSTRKAWSFGGSGGRNRLPGFGRLGKRFGGRGVSGDWMSIVKSVKALIAQQAPPYSQSAYINITYNGQTYKVRTDCSGFVGACLQIYGAIPAGTNITSASMLSQNALSDGFSYMPNPGWSSLQQGDIITRNGHIEIFDHNADGTHYVYSNGSTAGIASAEPTKDSGKHSYPVVWRPNNPGTGANVVTSGDFSSGSSSSSSISNPLTDTISKVGGVFTKFASKALTGILTGNWDYDFSDSSGSTDSSGTEQMYSTSNISGSNTKEKLYNFLIGNGLTPYGAAGLMGNLEAESGIQTNNVQNDYEKKVGSDEVYTAKVDNGSYTNFANDSVGYGLAQWTTSNRKAALYNLAKSEGKSIADEGVQFSHLMNELNGSYSGVLSTLKTATDVKTASNAVLHKFEVPKNAGASVENKRAALGQGIYDLYAGGGAGEGPSGGRGFKIHAKRTFGGRGLDTTASISSAQDNQYDVSTTSTVNNKSNNSESLDMKTITKLLNTTIQILQSIDTNTGKIEGLSNTQINSDNHGGNIIVSNSNNSAQVSGSNNTNTQSTNSRNASLAMQIAKGV